MPPSNPNPPWYQFSIRSLLLLTTFVAVLCSLGLCTHWIFSVVIGSAVLIGGIAGWIVARTRVGFVQGVVFGIQFVLIAAIMGVISLPLFSWEASSAMWVSYVLLGTASLIGGILGGLSVRPRSR